MSKVIDHAERRHAILSKARHLFAERGYNHVSMQEVAEVCGIARPILYKYFTDKRELFDSALAEMTQNIGQELAQSIVMNPKLTACAKLDLFLHKTIDLCLSNPALMRCIV
ncbi:MAG: TetR/AcrR family transcriptional regulator, partial [Victivallales bacterium]|nr:TetR/AcrR family transcriptional regulator [Victivallales bacterium]